MDSNGSQHYVAKQNKLCTYSAVTLFTELTLMFFFFYRIGLMYWNLKEKKKSLPNLWRAQNGHFFPIWKM